MYENLVDRDSNSFWKIWSSINKADSSLVTRIDGETDPQGIADCFSRFFETVYSNHDTTQHNAMKNDFTHCFSSYYSDHIDDNICPYYLTGSDMFEIVKKVKLGKASSGFLRPEHLFNGSPKLVEHLHFLFNSMIQHRFVPTDFLRGSITPIFKNSDRDDVSDSSFYRGITLSSLPAKLFEFAIQRKISHLLGTDDLQFGFKTATSTSHALYTLKSTVDFFTSRGSMVFVSFLDCTKAFDRVSHFGLFSKLMERKVPLCLLLCLIFWYLNMISNVKWSSKTSGDFEVPLGMKQGGINSPEFFSVYVDGLIRLLRARRIGCHIFHLFLAVILFADDICLLAPSRAVLADMMSICESYCDRHCLTFNSKKSKVMVFGRKVVSSFAPIKLNGSMIDYVDKICYLGTTIVNGPSLSFSATDDLCSFYRASNSILNVLNKPDEIISMKLLFTNCVPVISYACAIKEYSSREMSNCNVAINDAIRKIFSFKRSESVRELREFCGYDSIYEIFFKAKQKFQSSLIKHRNSIISSLAVILT